MVNTHGRLLHVLLTSFVVGFFDKMFTLIKMIRYLLKSLFTQIVFTPDSVTPRGTFIRLKLALLLSLVSQHSSDSKQQVSGGNLHILTISKDILPLQRLFFYSKSFAGHSLSYSTCNDLCFSISADQRNNNTCIIHGMFWS